MRALLCADRQQRDSEDKGSLSVFSFSLTFGTFPDCGMSL
jgi:hypothetical protein